MPEEEKTPAPQDAPAEEDAPPELPRTAKDVMLNGLQAAVYMLVVRALAGWWIAYAVEDPEEGIQGGRASSMFVGFVIVFHRFPGPAALGLPLSILQLASLVLYYVAGAAYFYGDTAVLDQVMAMGAGGAESEL